MDESSDRKQFLDRLRALLEEGDYAILKHELRTLSDLSEKSDVDILIRPGRLEPLVQAIRSDPSAERVRLLTKSYMTTMRVFFRDGGFLQIDLLHAFIRKSYRFLDAEAVLSESAHRSEKRERVPSPPHEFAYPFLFSLLNRADLPKKYQEYFSSIPEARKLEILGEIRHSFGVTVPALEDLYRYDSDRHKAVLRSLRERKGNSRLDRIMRTARYLGDVAGGVGKGRRGILVTFSGVDGSGKSTVLEEVRQELVSRYRQDVVVLRHRPSLLPILSAFRYGKRAAEARTVTRLPRTGSNRSTTSSALRFSYYLSDYLVGQWVILARHLARGKLVLYDRYFFDFIVDGLRSNIRLPPPVAKFFWLFLMNPDLNVLLYAPADVVRSRKRELDFASIEKLTGDYLALFKELQAGDTEGRFLSIENLDIQRSVREIVGRVRELL